MVKKRIVIDTNNLISALGWRGNSRDLFIRVIEGKYDLLISEKQMEELRRVLGYKKFGFTESEKKKFLDIIHSISLLVEVKTKIDITDDKNDDFLIECAVDGGADFIISGDDDILRLKKFGRINVMKVKDFLEDY